MWFNYIFSFQKTVLDFCNVFHKSAVQCRQLSLAYFPSFNAHDIILSCQIHSVKIVFTKFIFLCTLLRTYFCVINLCNVLKCVHVEYIFQGLSTSVVLLFTFSSHFAAIWSYLIQFEASILVFFCLEIHVSGIILILHV